MKHTPFKPDQDYAPLPFTDRLCQESMKLKSSGLPWIPHVGCFVWDPLGVIQEKSPFPNRVYFILNLGHFIRRFGDAETLTEKAVWLPTLYQIKALEETLPQLDFEPAKQCYEI